MYYKRFYKDDFIKQVYDPHKPSAGMSRKRARGFPIIEAKFVDFLVSFDDYNNTYPTMIELGIGSGNAFKVWDNHFRGKIYGIEIFHPTLKIPEKDFFYLMPEHHSRNQKNYDISSKIPFERPQINFFYGFDAYDKKTVDMLVDINGGPFDIVIDDADPSGGAMKKLLPAWKDAISPNGILISETIYGNGIPELKKMSLIERTILLKPAIEQGFVCLDTTKWADIVDTDPNTNGVSCNHLSVWSPQLKFYRPLLKELKDHIVTFTKLPLEL